MKKNGIIYIISMLSLIYNKKKKMIIIVSLISKRNYYNDFFLTVKNKEKNIIKKKYNQIINKYRFAKIRKNLHKRLSTNSYVNCLETYKIVNISFLQQLLVK